jgi:hypothetical protein
VNFYKNNVSYVDHSKPSDITILEAYLILTKKFFFLFDLSQEEYPMIPQQPIKVEEIQAIQLSHTNTLAGVIKVKGRSEVKFVVFEDDTLEQFVLFVKAAFGTRLALEYNDVVLTKNDKAQEVAFNLNDMRYFDPKDLKQRFGKPQYYGFLEKVSCNWRSKVSSLFGGGVKWVKKMYVIKNGSIYVYEENQYDKPSKVFAVGNLSI